MKNRFAPVCLFVYNRPWHTKQTVEALLQNELVSETDLIIFSDGAKTEKDTPSVEEVRSFIDDIQGFNSVTIYKSKSNQGLAKSIIGGVNFILEKHDKVIVLEDDMLTSPYFLRYMNDALNVYRNEDMVASIHAYVYPIQGLPNTFFLRGADCWGWATWARSWKIFEPDGSKLLKQIKQRGLEREINYNNSTKYVKMLKDQIKGKNDSWAIRWHLSVFLNDKLTLYSGKSFIRNIGCDYSGQHSIATNIFDPIMCENYIELEKIPIIESLDARKLFEIYYHKTRKSILTKGLNHFFHISKKYLLKT